MGKAYDAIEEALTTEPPYKIADELIVFFWMSKSLYYKSISFFC